MAWIGQVVVVEDADIAVERVLIENFCTAVEDGNPLYWDADCAAAAVGTIIAPPAMLSAWTRPHEWSPTGGTMARRPLELHFRLKDTLGLPKAVVVDSEVCYYEPVRPGDRVRAEQVLDEVGPLQENRLGHGRKWTISIFYYRAERVMLGHERLCFFAYGAVP